jgi:F0F1-type ATP synthase assembly protein I
MRLKYNGEKRRVLENPVKYIIDSKSHYIQGDCVEDEVSIELGFLDGKRKQKKKDKVPFYNYNSHFSGNSYEGELVRLKEIKGDVMSIAISSGIVFILGFLIGFFAVDSLSHLKWGLIIGLSAGCIIAALISLMFWNERRMMLKLADRFMLKNTNCRRR